MGANCRNGCKRDFKFRRAFGGAKIDFRPLRQSQRETERAGGASPANQKLICSPAPSNFGLKNGSCLPNCLPVAVFRETAPPRTIFWKHFESKVSLHPVKMFMTPVMMAVRWLRWVFPVALLFSSIAQAQLVVGYFTDHDTTTTVPAAGITLNGYVAQQISDIAAFNFNTVQVLVINEEDNASYSAALTSQASAIATWVQNGGLLLFHDRFVDGSPPLPSALLPGASGITFVRNLAADIDLANTPNFISNGSFGTLTNTSLDGGNSSDHGYAVVSTLPTGSVVYLTAGSDATKAVGFAYKFGSGGVYYSTIPLDFYLGGNTPATFADIYYPNLLSGVTQLGAVPEPSTVALFLAGLLGLGAMRKFRFRK